MYGFNPLTPFDLILLPSTHEYIHKDGLLKAEFVQKLHERIKIKYNNKVRDMPNKTIGGRGSWFSKKGIGFGSI